MVRGVHAGCLGSVVMRTSHAEPPLSLPGSLGGNYRRTLHIVTIQTPGKDYSPLQLMISQRISLAILSILINSWLGIKQPHCHWAGWLLMAIFMKLVAVLGQRPGSLT